jgi:hypothetical protein
MKSTAFILGLFISVLVAQAQTERFTGAMLSNLELAKNAQNIDDFQQLANNFERIAAAEKTEWTPWYYAAYYNLVINFQDTDSERKTKYIALAEQHIETGLKLRPEETELLVLKVMAYYAEMAVDPMKGMTLFGEANALLDRAKSLSPANPRIYLMQAEAVYGMPVEFGGGKDKALPILLLAKEKFDNFVPADQLSPVWGKERCETLLASCKENR